MLSAFGDESSDETQARVFAVAGILGSADDWADFRQKWTDRLDGKVFHAADCEAGRGAFKDMGKSASWQLLNDLTSILAESRLMGYGVAVDIAGFRDVAPTVLADFPDMLYYDCFLRTILYLTDLAGKLIPRDKVEFTFDQHKVVQYNAGLLYEWITQFRNDMVEKISFATRREPGVQAADLWVREVMKRADSHLRNEPPNERPQLKTLLATKRFRAKLRIGSDLAEDLAEAGAISNQADRMGGEYDAWIKKHKLMDNLSNRFRFAAMTEWEKTNE